MAGADDTLRGLDGLLEASQGIAAGVVVSQDRGISRFLRNEVGFWAICWYCDSMTEPIYEAPTKRKRRQVMTEMGRQLLQRERQRMAKEQALLGESLALEAQRNLAMVERNVTRAKPEDAAISRGIVRRVAGVLAVEGVHPVINCQPSSNMSAWTDFTKIHVSYRKHEDVRLTAATIRGLLYHEGGHMRWTVPFLDLLAQYNESRKAAGLEADQYVREVQGELQRAWNALEDQRMETAVVSDSPRKAAYFTPVIMTEHCETIASAAANYPLLVWRRYLPKRLRRAARAAFVLQHADMFGLDGAENITRKIERCITRYVTATDAETMWAAVVEFRDLLTGIRPIRSNLDDAGHGKQTRRTLPKDDNGQIEIPEIPIAPDMLDDESDEDESDEVEGDFPMPVPTPSTEDADESDDEGADDGAGAPSTDDGNEDEDDEDGDVVGGAGDEGDEDDDEGDDALGGDTYGSLLDEQPMEGTPTPSDGDEDEDGEGAGEKSDTPTEHGPGTEDDDEDDDLTQEDLDDMIADAEEDRLNDSALDGDVDAYADALENQVSSLPAYVGGLSSDAGAQAQAEALAEEIERAFQAATMDRQPAWVEQQRRGIINVNRYLTRNPGDDEFYRNWVEDDQPGFNIAVSVLLDYSSSMSQHTTELAQVGYATKLACSKLGVPCTVTLWDDSATVLYDALEVAEGMPLIDTRGSTNPDTALADLPNQRYDKEHHIVLIMTDGEWDTAWSGGGGGARSRKNREAAKRTLLHYATDGQYLIGFGYDGENNRNADSLAESLTRKGCPEAYGITNLMEIPHRLEEALLALA